MPHLSWVHEFLGGEVEKRKDTAGFNLPISQRDIILYCTTRCFFLTNLQWFPLFFFFLFSVSQLSEPSWRVGVKFVCFLSCNLSIPSCQGSLSSDLWIHRKLPKRTQVHTSVGTHLFAISTQSRPAAQFAFESEWKGWAREGCLCWQGKLTGSQNCIKFWLLGSILTMNLRAAIFMTPGFLEEERVLVPFGFICLSGDLMQLVSVEPRRSLGTFENMRMCFCFRKYTCITWHWE